MHNRESNCLPWNRFQVLLHLTQQLRRTLHMFMGDCRVLGTLVNTL